MIGLGQSGIMFPFGTNSNSSLSILPGGVVSANATSSIQGYALLECVLLDSGTVLENKNVSLSSCQRSYYWLPQDNTTLTLILGPSSQVSSRDPALIARAAVAAAAVKGGATVITDGTDAGNVLYQNFNPSGNETVWYRAIVGGTGAYKGVTGEEKVVIPVKIKGLIETFEYAEHDFMTD